MPTSRAPGVSRNERGGAFVIHLAVGEIARDDHVVLLRERDHAFVEAGRRQRGGRIVRVVDPHDLRAPRDVGRDRVQVDEEAVLAAQRKEVGLAAREPGQRRVHGIARVGAEHDVARVDEREREVRDRLLRSDHADDLFLRVERQVEARLHERGGGLAEVFHADVRRVAVGRRIARRFGQRGDDVRRRRQIRIADAEVDEVLTLLAFLVLERVDAREQVRGQLPDAVRQLDLHAPIFSIFVGTLGG